MKKHPPPTIDLTPDEAEQLRNVEGLPEEFYALIEMCIEEVRKRDVLVSEFTIRVIH